MGRVENVEDGGESEFYRQVDDGESFTTDFQRVDQSESSSQY